jgi:hypothetical protein
MRRFFYENGLTIVLLGFALFSLAGQSIAGLHAFNEEQREHGEETVRYTEYLGEGHFLEAVAENWESEFLQMGMLVVLTIFLRQKGAKDSKKLSGSDESDKDPLRNRSNRSPLPVRMGGLALEAYKYSLSVALFSLFAFSFALHVIFGSMLYNSERLAHGESAASMTAYLGSAEFWYESFQNWQSEFLSVAILLILSIFLRQHGSQQSKPVHAPHWQTGE